jgi:hypothetical protein
MYWNNGYFTNQNDAMQNALAFVQAQGTYVESQVYRQQYAELQYRDLVPVDTSAPEWTQSITFYSMDTVGQARWFEIQSVDIPMADLTKAQFEQGVSMAAIGYRWNIEEVQRAMSLGIDLPGEKAGACRRAAEEFLDDKGLRGDAVKGWTGIFNATAPV